MAHKAQIKTTPNGQFELTSTRTEVLDRTALTMHRRQLRAELDAVEQDVQRMQDHAEELRGEIAEIDAALGQPA